MSLSLVPGYDFTFNELVTTEKLRKWIGGAHNTASLTAAEVGVSTSNTGDNLHTTATWATTATVGALTFNTSTGWVEITTPRGSVPIFGTQGGLFTKRLREGESDEESFDRFYEGDVPNVLGVKPGHTPTLPAASYSLGDGYDDFGMNTIHVGACIQAASDLSGVRGSKTFARYPSEHSFNPSGAWTAATYATGTTYVHSLYKLGGAQTLRFKFYAAPSSIGGTALSSITLISDILNAGNNRCTGDYTNAKFFDGVSGTLQMFTDSTDVSLIAENTPAAGIGDCGGIDCDSTNRLVFYLSKANNNCHVFKYNDSAVSYVGNFATIARNSSDGIPIVDPSNNCLFVARNSRAQIFTYNSAGSAFSSVTNEDMGGAYCHGSGLYSSDHDCFAICGRDSGMFFFRSIGNTTLTLLHSVSGGARRLSIARLKTNYFLSDADDGLGMLVYAPTNMSSVSLVERPSLSLNGRQCAYTDDYAVFSGQNNSELKLWTVSGGTATQVGAVAMGSNGFNCWNGHALFNCFYGNDNLRVFEPLHRFVGGGGSTAASGMRGDTSSGLWEIPASGSDSADTPTRVVPFSQCFNYYGAKQLSVGMVNPVLSKDDFRTGGYEF